MNGAMVIKFDAVVIKLIRQAHPHQSHPLHTSCPFDLLHAHGSLGDFGVADFGSYSSSEVILLGRGWSCGEHSQVVRARELAQRFRGFAPGAARAAV